MYKISRKFLLILQIIIGIAMLNHLPLQYWNQFKDFIIAVGTFDSDKEVATLEDFYQKLANLNNESNKKYHINLPDDTAKSLFMKFIERPSIRILDESYILKYMVMRIVTYFYYEYYENPRPVDPMVIVFDSEANVKHKISSDMWRWWVEEMDY